MSDILLSLEKPSGEAIAWAASRLDAAGLQVLRTFDLQDARHTHIECACPHHGTDRCDCQMVVLLVFADHCQPASLVAHSYDGHTSFSLVDTPQQRADPYLETAIRRALSSTAVIIQPRD